MFVISVLMIKKGQHTKDTLYTDSKICFFLICDSAFVLGNINSYLTARCYTERGYAKVCRLSVCLYVRLSVRLSVWLTDRFFCAPGWPHPYSTLILGVFPLHQIAHVGVSPSRSVKLFGREIVFEVGLFQLVRKSYLNVTYRQTDRQTDGRTDRHNRALRA